MQFFCQFQDVHPFPLQTEAWVKRYVGTKYYAASNECTMAGAAVKTFLCLAHICSTLFATVDVDRSACRFASDCPIMSEVQEADQFVRVKNTKFCNFVNVSEVPRYHYAKFCVVWMVNLQSDWQWSTPSGYFCLYGRLRTVTWDCFVGGHIYVEAPHLTNGTHHFENFQGLLSLKRQKSMTIFYASPGAIGWTLLFCSISPGW